MTPPSITTFEISDSEIPGFPPQTFDTLDAAEQAIRAAWHRAPAATSDAERRVWYGLTASDGWSHAGELDLSAPVVDTPGFLLAHLRHAASVLTRPHRRPAQIRVGNALRAHLPYDAPGPRNSVAPPPLARVEILWSENGAVSPAVYRSLADADTALAHAFRREAPPPGGAYNKTAFQLVWVDGQAHEGRADVRRVDVASAPAAGGILRQHLRLVGTWLRDNAATWSGWTADEQAAKAAWGAELLRRLDAEPPMTVGRARRRNADASVVPIARVELLPTSAPEVAAGTYRTIDAAEAVVRRAFADLPQLPPGQVAPLLDFRVVWADGFRDDHHSYVWPALMSRASDEGLLRYALRTRGISMMTGEGWGAKGQAYGSRPGDVERIAHGTELLRRLARRNGSAIADDALLPVGTTSEVPGVSLLPDPFAAVARLEGHYASLRPPAGVWGGGGRTVPATTNRDVIEATNWLSLALAHDIGPLRHLTGRSHGTIWDRWAKSVGEVQRRLRPDRDATYADNDGFWTDQVPHLAHKVARALAAGAAS